jgi:hypothetical protein
MTRAFHIELIINSSDEEIINEEDVRYVLSTGLRSHLGECSSSEECPYHGFNVTRVTEARQREARNGRQEAATYIQDFVSRFNELRYDPESRTYVTRDDRLGTTSDTNLS